MPIKSTAIRSLHQRPCDGICTLAYAGDIVILATTAAELKDMLSCLQVVGEKEYADKRR